MICCEKKQLRPALRTHQFHCRRLYVSIDLWEQKMSDRVLASALSLYSRNGGRKLRGMQEELKKIHTRIGTSFRLEVRHAKVKGRNSPHSSGVNSLSGSKNGLLWTFSKAARSRWLSGPSTFTLPTVPKFSPMRVVIMTSDLEKKAIIAKW